MKLSMSERRKLNNRLPLWESAYKSGNATERKELIVKIEDARKKLGMPMFLKEQPAIKENEVSINKRNQRILNTQKKYGNEFIKGRNITLRESLNLANLICNWHNKENLTDSQISKKIGRTRWWIVTFKKKFIDEQYLVVNYKERVNFNEYINLLNEGKNIGYICEYFKVDYQYLKKWKENNLKVRYSLLDGYKVCNKKTIDFLEDLVPRMNNGETLRKIALSKKMNLPHLYMVKKKYIEEKIIYNPEYKLNPYIYVELKEKGLNDIDIANEFGVSQCTITNMKNKYIKLIYKLKNF